MKNLLLVFLLVPFLASSQQNDDSLLVDSGIVTFPESSVQFDLVQEYEKLDDTLLNVSFAPTKSKKVRAVRAGILEAHMKYSHAFDTTTFDLAPIFENDSINYDGLQSKRAPKAEDSILTEYLLTLVSQVKIKSNPELTSLNQLLKIGEWSESMFLVSKYVRKERNMSIASKVLEQEAIVDTILVILNNCNENSEFNSLIESFTELQSTYQGIKRKYKYSKPKIDKKTQTTTIRSKVVIKGVRKSFIAIENQLTEIRTIIIN